MNRPIDICLRFTWVDARMRKTRIKQIINGSAKRLILIVHSIVISLPFMKGAAI